MPATPQPAKSLPGKSLHDNLRDRLTEYIQYSKSRARAFGWLYGALRMAIIVMSVCAAAKGIGVLENWAPVLALLVAILTGIDTWLKPAVKLKTHYEYNDRYIARETEFAGIEATNVAALNDFRTSLDSLDAEYRKAALD